MEILKIGQELFCPEHGKQEIEAVDVFGSMTEYILACGDIINK